jgi:hypothetical protein
LLTFLFKFGYPLFGFPQKDKEVAFSAFDGTVIKDERFATIRYKRQQSRTLREAKHLQQGQPEFNSQLQTAFQSGVATTATHDVRLPINSNNHDAQEIFMTHSLVDENKINTQFVKAKVE